MRKQSRYSISYKIQMWWYRLTKEDVKKFIQEIIENVEILLVMIAVFFIIFILPAFFY